MTRLIRFGFGGVFLLALALGVVSSGLIPLAASAGHWAMTEWLLHFTMRRTVIARSIPITVPPLDDPALVLRGAGHFETGCRPCHGAPGSPQPVTLRNMTPRPPFLSERVPQWEPDELFWIVKHGIKFTGMPGWPVTEREDEVWAMVAFLLELPDLTKEEYRRLAQGDQWIPSTDRSRLVELSNDTPVTVLANCSRCHGIDGQGRGVGAFPRLAGQSEAFLHASLKAYASGSRRSGIMQPIAAELSDETMRELSRYYAGLPTPRLENIGNSEWQALSRGEAVVREGVPARRVPSCADCHGPTTRPRKTVYPRLAGQYADYLVLQLELFKAGVRGGTPYAHLMHPVASNLKQEQMREVALYYSFFRE